MLQSPFIQKEKLSLREHNQKLLQITSKPQHQINGLKVSFKINKYI